MGRSAENRIKNPCTREQLEMIDGYFAGKTKKQAFMDAFPERGKMKAVSTMAWEEFQKPQVAAEVQRREAARDRAMSEAAMTEAEHIAALWSREKSVTRLIEIADACQAARIQAAEDGAAFPAVTARLERDTVDSLNKMLGYDAPVKLEQDQQIHVRFDGGDGPEDWRG